MTMQTRTLRRAVPADAPALAALHHAVWQTTYEGLAPAEAAARLDVAHRRRGWEAALADPARGAWLVEGDEGLVGLVAIGPPGEDAAFAAQPGPVGEIKHLYVAPGQRRQGLGQRLLETALEALAAQGCATGALGVVRQNYAARLFYADTGGREVADFTDPGPLWRSLMVLVAWDLSGRR